jgi:serine/threonine-protein kinase RsbW
MTDPGKNDFFSTMDVKPIITCSDGGFTKYTLKMPCHPKYLRIIRNFTSEIAQKCPFTAKDIFQLELVMDEACMNAIDHGSSIKMDRTFEVSFIIENERLLVLIKDFGGKPFNPDYFEKISEKKTWGHGGRGIHIIKQLMDEVMYFFNNGKSTLLSMSKFFPK